MSLLMHINLKFLFRWGSIFVLKSILIDSFFNFPITTLCFSCLAPFVLGYLWIFLHPLETYEFQYETLSLQCSSSDLNASGVIGWMEFSRQQLIFTCSFYLPWKILAIYSLYRLSETVVFQSCFDFFVCAAPNFKNSLIIREHQSRIHPFDDLSRWNNLLIRIRKAHCLSWI